MITKRVFGQRDGAVYDLYTITNTNGMEVGITPLGAIITSIKIPEDNGMRELVLGFDRLEEYFSEDYQAGYPYLGAVIGRNAGRISHSEFQLDSRKVQLTPNLDSHHLHGGKTGFDRKFWNVEEIGDAFITLSYFSGDGEEGYPGNVRTTVRYTLTKHNELKVEFFAGTDAETVVNLTQHTYFNLNHDNGGNILSHRLQVNADHYVPLSAELLPTGEILPVEQTSFDYRSPKNPDAELDLSFPLKDGSVAGILESPDCKVRMTVSTTQPVLHIYTGYYLPQVAAEGRKKLDKNAGICFETQGFADAPNHPAFKTTILKPGQNYHQETIFKFEF